MLLSWMVLGGAGLVLAAEEHASEPGSGEAGLLSQLYLKPRLLVIQILGFVLLWYLLQKFLYAPINTLLQEREQRIRQNDQRAEEHRQQMEQLRAEYEQRLAEIEREARDRIQVATREAQAARDEILAEARAERERIVAAGVDDIRREKEKALVEIRDQVAELALFAAGRVIERSLDEPAHRALIDEIVDGIIAH